MSNAQMIKFKVDNTPLFAKKLDVNETLSKIRKKFGDKFPKGSVFVCSDGTEILLEDEKDFTLKDIIENKDNSYVLHLNVKEIKEEKCSLNKKPKNEIISEDILEEQEQEEIEELEEADETIDFSIESSWLNNDSKEEDETSYPISHNNEKKVPSNKFKINQNHEKEMPRNNNNINKSKNNKLNHNHNQKEVKLDSKGFKKAQNFQPPPAANKFATKKENHRVKNIPKFTKEDLSKFQLKEKIGNLKIYFYPSAKFNALEEMNAITFMVVGETGCGKTTLLNSFINSLLGVEINDDFRFKIILENGEKSQAYSQTSEVTYYNIRSVGGYPPVKIIDTPGYGDTRGIQRDKEITAQIKELFYNKISTLNAVCFVTKSSNNRLSHSQRYILSSILDLFGEDVKEIFVFMLTFCDGGEPNIIKPLQEDISPFCKIIKLYKNTTWYYKFNNSAIFEDNRKDEFTKMFWKLGMKNFSDFKKKLITLPPKSLVLSRTVLAQRKYLEDKVQILSTKLKVGLNKMEEIKGIMKMVLNLKGDLNDSKNFTKTIKQPSIKKIPKDPNYYATTCITCTKTCHSQCRIADDDKKKNVLQWMIMVIAHIAQKNATGICIKIEIIF